MKTYLELLRENEELRRKNNELEFRASQTAPKVPASEPVFSGMPEKPRQKNMGEIEK